MADDWDDDDFGTFESADVGSPVGSTISSTSSAAPAWLLTAQTPQTQDTVTKAQEDSKDAECIPSMQAKELEVEQVHGKPEEESSKKEDCEAKDDEQLDGSETPNDPEASDATSDNKNPFSRDVGPVLDDAFADIFGSDPTPKHLLNNSATPETNSDKSPPLPPAEEPAINHDSKIVAELQGKLDNALILKQQSEKSIADLREELKRTVEEHKAELKTREEAHHDEVAKLHQQKEEEITQTKDDAQQAMKSLTQQYTELCARIAKEQQIQFEKQLGEVTQKCVELLELQHSSMEERIKEEVARRSGAVDNMLDACKRDVNTFVTSQCDETVERCGRASEGVEAHLKEKIADELEEQRKIDLRCKEEAMEELTKLHKEQLQHAMAEERLKSSEATRRAVDDAQNVVRAAINEEQEKARQARERHLLAIKMLLTSSQEHLSLLSDDVKLTT